MPATLWGFSRAVLGNTAGFYKPGNNFDATGTEFGLVMRIPGTFSNLAGSVDNNSTSRVIQWRKNAANGNGQVSFTDGIAQVAFDNTHQDHHNLGDTADFKFSYTLVTTAPFCFFVKGVFTADIGHGSFLGGGSSTPPNNSFLGIGSTVSQASTEALAQTMMRTAGTVTNLSLTVTAQNTGTQTARFRKNGVAGNNNVTTVASMSGTFEDITNSDTFVPGDLITYGFTQTVTAPRIHACCFVSYNQLPQGGWSNEVMAGQGGGGAAFNAADQFGPIIGASVTPVGLTESNWQVQHGFPVGSSNFRVTLDTNTMTSATTFATRVNGADGKQSVSIPAGMTGSFEDLTNQDFYGATDNVNYVVRGGTSGSIRATMITQTETIAAPPPNVAGFVEIEW